MHEYLNAILMGIVEGATEFIPVSSTGHLILLERVIELPPAIAGMFQIVIQLGAILAVVVHFRRRFFPFPLKDDRKRAETFDLYLKLIVALIPAIVLGALLGAFIQKHLFAPVPVAIALLVGGVALIYFDKESDSAKFAEVSDLTLKAVFIIGLFQCLAMFPGTSRSAATIIGAMWLGTSRKAAAEFSFFLAVPTMAAATAYSLFSLETLPSASEWLLVGIGFVTSFVVALAVIVAFMRFIAAHNFKPFGYYRIVLGCVILLYFTLA